MGGNIGSNGIIQINKKEGLSAAIAREAGLNDNEITQLNNTRGAWSNIFALVNEQQTKAANNTEGYTKLYSGGNDLNSKDYKHNYVVQENTVLTFAQDIWNKILDEINKALGKTDGNKLVYDAENTTNDSNDSNGTQPPVATPLGGTTTPAPTQSTEEQASLKTQTEILMDNALNANATINKQERQNEENLQGYIYSYVEAKEGDAPINAVFVNTDVDGKPTKVIVMTPKDDGGTVTTEYNLEQNTMKVERGEAVTLPEDQLATVKEKAFLMVNNEQLSKAKKAVTDVVNDLKGENSYVGQNLELKPNGDLRLKLSDGRQVNIRLNNQGEITMISFVNDRNSGDDTTDIVLYDNGNIWVDRDNTYSTSQDNKSITQTDVALFNELKTQLQPLVAARKNEIANLRMQADDKFTRDNNDYFNRAEQTISEFENLAGVDNTPNEGKNLNAITGIRYRDFGVDIGNNTKQYRLYINGKSFGVNIQTKDGTSKITAIFINNNRSLGLNSDFKLYDTGKIWIDKDMQSDGDIDATTDDQVMHIYSNTEYFDTLKVRVIKILQAKYPASFNNLT